MNGRYEAEFYEALDRGRSNEFHSTRYPNIEGKLLTQNIIDVIGVALNDNMNGDISLLAGECFKVHFRMMPVIEQILSVNAYITIGYININGKNIHKMQLSKLVERLRAGPITEKNT